MALGLLFTVAVVLVSLPQCLSQNITRGSFPEGFVFGTASSAFQYEGAVQEDGRGLTVWDIFSHTVGRISDNSTADVAVDQYHLYPDDIQLMKSMGMDAYRFSISWSRIFPDGAGEINQAGVDYYNSLIDALIAEGIEPYVTLYHWDLPQALEDKYTGWLDPQIINDFAVYAETCFKEFGDRVKQWITFNEPHSFILQGYDFGFQPPGRCSINISIPIFSCTIGNSSTEPYLVAHNVLLSHATAAHIYRQNYKEKQQGSVGLSFDVIWLEPITNSTEDIEATQRGLDFHLGWFLEPLMFGDYPNSMKNRVGSRLPNFTSDETGLLKGSLDFVGINHYTTFYADHDAAIWNELHDFLTDSNVLITPRDQDGQFIGDRANSPWLYIVPRGMRSLMNYINHKYGNPPVIITENGMDDANDPSIPIEDALRDEKRIKYHNEYLQSLLDSIKEDGCNVKGYFAWSLLDNWEWESGFSSRFGLFFVDYNDKLKRYPKDSVQWFHNFLNSP